MATDTQTVTLEQTVKLLASTDAELIGVQSRAELYGPLAFALIEFISLVSSPRRNLLSPGELWRIYKNTKEYAQRASGSLLARSLSSIGGGGICEKVDYCRNKARLKELFDFSDSPEGKAIFSKGVEAALETAHGETIEKLQEILGSAVEVIADAAREIAEEVSDSVIPVSFVFISIKYGFDELCKCCVACDGTGWLEDHQCEACGGNGHLRP